MKDASDYFDAGGTVGQLLELVEAAPVWTPSAGAADNVPVSLDGTQDNRNEEHDHGDPEPAAPSIEPIGIGDLIDQHPELYPEVVDGLIREGETTNIISTSKIGKTHLIWTLIFAVATGRMWLDRYQTRKGRVLVIDNELHPPTLADRAKRILAAMGIMRDEVAAQVDVIPLRGRLLDIYDVAKLLKKMEPGRYKLVVIDALYRTLPDGNDENSNADIMRVYNLLDACATHLRAAIVIIHHASKGSQSGKDVVDVGSGAGSQSRAADNHIILRPHKETDVVVMEARLRSHKSPDPICVRWNYPIWTSAPDLDATKLKSHPYGGGRPPKNGSRDAATEPEVVEWTPERFVAEFVTDTPRPREAIESAAHRRRIAFRTIGGLLSEAEVSGLIFLHKKPPSNATLYATKKPDLFNDAQRVSLSHTPPTPPGKRRRKAAATE